MILAQAKRKNRIRQRWDDNLFDVISTIFLALSVLVVAYPLLYVVSASFSSTNAVMSLPVNRMDGKLHHYALPVMNIESLPGESVNLSQLFVNGGILSVVVPGQEPTEHLLLESAQLCSRIIREKRHILYLVRNQADTTHPAIARPLQLLGANASVAILRNTDVLMQMRQTLRVGDSRLPFSMAVNRRSKILYAYANYNIGTVETLLDILKNDTGGATEAEPAQSPAR